MVLKKQSSQKYKIVIDLPFGPFNTASDVVAAKKKIKAKVSKIAFSSATKTSRGYKFSGRLSYIKSIAAPRDVVLKVMKERSPNSKISVTRV